MTHCNYCDIQLEHLPFKCQHCYKVFCGKCRLPENHKCRYVSILDDEQKDYFTRINQNQRKSSQEDTYEKYQWWNKHKKLILAILIILITGALFINYSDNIKSEVTKYSNQISEKINQFKPVELATSDKVTKSTDSISVNSATLKSNTKKVLFHNGREVYVSIKPLNETPSKRKTRVEYQNVTKILVQCSDGQVVESSNDCTQPIINENNIKLSYIDTPNSLLFGNWKAVVMGFEQIITLEPDKRVYLTNNLGSGLFGYEINGDKIIIKNIQTGNKIEEWSFAVIDNYKALKIKDVFYYPIDGKASQNPKSQVVIVQGYDSSAEEQFYQSQLREQGMQQARDAADAWASNYRTGSIQDGLHASQSVFYEPMRQMSSNYERNMQRQIR